MRVFKLRNGLTTIVDQKKTDSITIQATVKVGSNNESKKNNGISHFIEHMLFERTKKRSDARTISNEIECLGGILNAYTSSERTCFFIKVPRIHFLKALDILSDIIQNPLFNKEHLEKERKIILKEINLHKDEPRFHQCADIFYLKADITQLGMDQRKVNMLAREVGEKLGYWKPVVVSHHMLMGLGQPPAGEKTTDRAIELKMSKSKPDSAIFMTDSEEDIKRKMKKAWCPEGIVDENPILEYCKYIIFERFSSFVIRRPEKWGGNLEFSSYSELENEFVKKTVHPMDLKDAAGEYISKLIEPVRNKLGKSKSVQKLADEIKHFKVTR